MKADRGLLLERRVSRLTSELTALRDARVCAASTDAVRLQLLERAIELAEIGQEDLASEFLIHQARIGDPADYEALSRLARGLGLPSTQLYMANYAPAGGKADPASSYPAPKWMPATGWAIDPAGAPAGSTGPLAL